MGLLGQGIVLMVAGMGIVYLFLGVLIAVTGVSSKFVAKFDSILPQECYMMQNASGEDICRILSAFGIDNADRIYTKGGLAALKSGVKAF